MLFDLDRLVFISVDTPSLTLSCEIQAAWNIFHDDNNDNDYALCRY